MTALGKHLNIGESMMHSGTLLCIKKWRNFCRNYVSLLSGDSDQEAFYSPTPPPVSPFTPDCEKYVLNVTTLSIHTS